MVLSSADRRLFQQETVGTDNVRNVGQVADGRRRFRPECHASAPLHRNHTPGHCRNDEPGRCPGPVWLNERVTTTGNPYRAEASRAIAFCAILEIAWEWVGATGANSLRGRSWGRGGP
jgi:hypothetical protein